MFSGFGEFDFRQSSGVVMCKNNTRLTERASTESLRLTMGIDLWMVTG